MSRDTNEGIRTVLLILAGGLVGASVALLFAPQSGRRTRRNLQRLGNRMASRAQDFQEDLQERVEDLVEELRETGSEGLRKGREATVKVRDEILGTLQAGREILTEKIEEVENLLRR